MTELTERFISAIETGDEADAVLRDIVELMADMRLRHGMCQPRSERSCTHCNAVDDLNELVDIYMAEKEKNKCPHANIVSARNKVILSGLICNDCGELFPEGDEPGILWKGCP